jgi:formylglycine-generating enzyme required for sulfatase activity
LILVIGVSCGRDAVAADATCAGERRALLIANGDYRAADAQSSVPGRNARLLADELLYIGFRVVLQENLAKDAMRKAVRAFAEKIRSGDCTLLFFSGYGIQIGESAYLLPVDADIWTEKDVAPQSVALAEIAEALMNAGSEVELVILDASRRNPFERRFRFLSTGLGPIFLPRNSLFIASAGIGEVADDGDGETGIFIRELVKEMRAPALTVQDLFGRTRIGVERATDGRQRPFVLSTVAEKIPFGQTKAAASEVPGTRAALRNIDIPPSDLGPGHIFQDCDHCPEVVVIAPGTFAMGSDDFETEKPVRSVAIAASFAIGRSEVTIAQWDACVAAGGCSFRPTDPGLEDRTLPVAELSWYDAVAYVEWLSRVTGHRYRLPAETEWEYAARGGTTTAYWWGDEPRAGLANCRGCGSRGGRQTSPVGSYSANPFGLVDTAGNVAEWVVDCWSEAFRIGEAQGVEPAQTCRQRVVRGGSFDSGARYVRSSSRFPHDPGLRYYANGFRVLRELPAIGPKSP